MAVDAYGADDLFDCPNDRLGDYNKRHFVRLFSALEKTF